MTPVSTVPNWRRESVCRNDSDPDRWVDLPDALIEHDSGRISPNPAYLAAMAELRKVCGGCPVAEQCLTLASTQGLEGCFAGTDTHERVTEVTAASRGLVIQGMLLAGGSVTQIAQTLGVARMTVYRDIHALTTRATGTQRPAIGESAAA